jgi:large subunit ribosomal protein L13
MTPQRLQAKGSDRLFNKVLKGMLPKNRLGDKLLGNVYIYDGAEHPHQAQTPKTIDLNVLK